MEIWESLANHIDELLPNGWQAVLVEIGGWIVLRVATTEAAHADTTAPLTMMFIGDSVYVYATKDGSKGLHQTYGHLCTYYLTDPTSIDDIVALLNKRLPDYL